MDSSINYIPELDYESRNYQPFNGRQNHFCQDCIKYYSNLQARGITKTPFPFHATDKKTGEKIFRCQYDRRLVMDQVHVEDFDTEADYETAKRIADPVTWAYTELGWKPRWYQNEILCCSSQFKAIRAGRRIGKTESLAVYILWRMVTNKNYKVLIICPYVSQVNLIFDMIRTHIGKSPDLMNSVSRDIHSPPECIELTNGSFAKGFAVGGASSGDSTKIRGQDANLIVVDEGDFIPDEDLEVVFAIRASRSNVEMVLSSTPTGQHGRLYRLTHDKNDAWKEFWYVSAESPEWQKSPDVEAMFRSYYSPGGFAREFLAEWGAETEGIFKDRHINASLRDYKYEDNVPDHDNCTYTIGVDWNKTTGTHITVTERPKTGTIWYKLVDKKIIPKGKFTQLDGVKAVLAMDRKWNPAFVYCDAGFGTVQMEMFYSHETEKLPGEKCDFCGGPHLDNIKRRYKAIEMGGNTLMPDPITKQPKKHPTKGLMVYQVADQMERGRIILPRFEDTTTPIIPEEIPNLQIGVVQQARSYKVEKVSSQTGRETFSDDYEHTLVSWMLSVFAHLMEFGDYRKLTFAKDIVHIDQMGGGKASISKDRAHIFYNEMGERRTPSEVHRAMMREAEERKQELAARRSEMTAARKRAQRGPEPGPTGPPLPEIVPGTKEILVAKNGMAVQPLHYARFRDRSSLGGRRGVSRRGFGRGGRRGI